MTDVAVFHAGTASGSDPFRRSRRPDRHRWRPSRVLNVTALGDTLADAQARAYEAVRAIRFTGAWYRHDIADRAIKAARSK